MCRIVRNVPSLFQVLSVMLSVVAQDDIKPCSHSFIRTIFILGENLLYSK